MRFTLLTDGSSDQALLPVLDWLLLRHTEVPFERQWADLRALPNPPKGLVRRIEIALHLYPCDLLFVHRDAEREPRLNRVAEIRAALADQGTCPIAVCVVPVRMQEAWFLFDERALREAADKPTGKHPLNLPKLSEVEYEPDPKQRLHDLLHEASGLRGRHSKRFRPSERVHRLAWLIKDFSPLLLLPAFNALDRDIGEAVAHLI
jgi:hypothetical protein